MAEDKNKQIEELQDELLDEVSGGVCKKGNPVGELNRNNPKVLFR